MTIPTEWAMVGFGAIIGIIVFLWFKFDLKKMEREDD